MAKVHNAKNREGKDIWLIVCPACGNCHPLDERWTFNGDYDKPTFRASLLVNAGSVEPSRPVCHSFITDGKIQYLSDCTHKLAGQTVELGEF